MAKKGSKEERLHKQMRKTEEKKTGRNRCRNVDVIVYYLI